MPPQGRGIYKPPMSLAEFVTTQERGKAPPKGPAIQPEMSLLAWLAHKGEKLGQALGTYDPWALAMPMEGPVKKAASKAATTLAEATKPITAYHGSPHDFDKFDISKIGTGEGAQAYSHGLYFAENPKVATEYKLAGPEADKQFTKINTRLSELAKEMDKSAIPGEHRKFRTPEGLQAADEYDRLLEAKNKIGKLYTVDINAHPDDFLDWDKPLSQQSEKVRQIAKELKLDGSEEALYEQAVRSGFTKDGARKYAREQAYEPTGEHIYAALGRNQVGSDKLKAAGIKGVRYLDQGSRGATGGELIDVSKAADGWKAKIRVLDRGGSDYFTTSKPHATEAEARKWAESKINRGTSNYVVFDDSIIDIRKKMALLLGLGGSGAAATQLPQRKQQ